MKRIITILLASTMILTNLTLVFAADTDRENIILTDVEDDSAGLELSEKAESDVEEDIALAADEETVDDITNDTEKPGNDVSEDDDLADFIKNSSLEPDGTGEEVNDGSYKGTVNSDGTVTITGFYNGLDDRQVFTIPRNIDGKTVTAIGDGAFYKYTDLNSAKLTIPDTVKTIGNWAFYGSGFYSGGLSIPNSVVSVGEKAFYNCNIPGGLKLGNNLREIGKAAFASNRFQEDLVIPDSVNVIGDYAFANSGITGSLKIGNNVKSIGECAFSREENNESHYNSYTGDLIIPDSVETIGDGAFATCVFRGKLRIGNRVKTIGDHAFGSEQWNTSANNFKGNLIIPDSVTTIGEGAFANCGFKGSLKMGTGIKAIGDNAFLDNGHGNGNDFNGNLNLPKGLKTIGKNAFYACGFSGKLTLPTGITEIEDGTFYGCNFKGDLTIPNKVKIIGKQAFDGCLFNGTLTIPKTVKDINDQSETASFRCPLVRRIINKSNIKIRAWDFFGAGEDYTKVYFMSSSGKKINYWGVLKKGTYTKGYIKVNRVELDKKTAKVLKGQKLRLYATISPSSATIQKVTWKSSDKKVATVSSNGVITGKKAGRAIITVTTKDRKKTAKCKITVVNLVKVKSIKLNNNTAFISKGETITLIAKITPKNATNQKVTWKSSNSSIASVSKEGVVIGKNPGTATITVTTKDGGKTDKCKVTVK